MSRLGTFARTLAVVAAGAAGAYGAYAAAAWYRYGRLGPADPADRDVLLERFLPVYEVVDRHAIRVEAPAALTLAAARETDLTATPILRKIFAGWAVLGEVPDRELVLGTVRQPWQPDGGVRSVSAGQFAAFAEPGYAKIAFSLRADPLGPAASLLRIETRVATTDPQARATFRRTWAAFSAGIHLVRPLLLRTVRREAERRWRVRGPV